MLLKRIKWRNVAKLLIAVTGAAVCISYAYGKTYDCYSQTSSKEMIVASHVQEEGFKEYEIPEAFASEGGKMDLHTQKRTWYACHAYHVSYPLVLAVIEAESGYKAEARNNLAGAIGYMQIVPGWHQARISRMNADIEEIPIDNILVGIDYLSELQKHCDDPNYLLMAYSMGLSEATRQWFLGVHSTEYSRYVIRRSKEITKELDGAYI